MKKGKPWNAINLYFFWGGERGHVIVRAFKDFHRFYYDLLCVNPMPQNIMF